MTYARDARVRDLAVAFGSDQGAQNEAIAAGALVAARARDAAGVVPQQFGDGEAGWQIAINAAIDALHAQGGGKLVLPVLPSGYSVAAPIVLKSGVWLDLNGNTITLASGANCNVIEGQDYLTLTGTNSGAGISAFRVMNGTIDGNRADNPSGGHCLAFYGRDFVLERLTLKNARRRGLHSEYGNTSVGISPFNGRVYGLTFDTCGEEGWLNEVSDLQGGNLNFASCGQNADNTYDAMVMVKGSRLSMGAIWRKGIHTNRHRYGVRLLGGSTITGFNVETSATAAWRLEGGENHALDGYTYNNMGAANVEMAGQGSRFTGRIGRSSIGEANAAAVAFVGAAALNSVDVIVSGLSAGSVEFRSYTGSYNSIRLRGSKASGGLLTGSPVATDELDLSVQVGANNVEMRKRRVVFTSVAASGTDQSSAAPLSQTINHVSGADGIKGVILPAGIEGLEVTVSNPGAGALKIYPASGQSIAGTGGANLPLTMNAGAGSAFVYAGGRWVSA